MPPRTTTTTTTKGSSEAGGNQTWKSKFTDKQLERKRQVDRISHRRTRQNSKQVVAHLQEKMNLLSSGDHKGLLEYEGLTSKLNLFQNRLNQIHRLSKECLEVEDVPNPARVHRSVGLMSTPSQYDSTSMAAQLLQDCGVSPPSDRSQIHEQPTNGRRTPLDTLFRKTAYLAYQLMRPWCGCYHSHLELEALFWAQYRHLLFFAFPSTENLARCLPWYHPTPSMFLRDHPGYIDFLLWPHLQRQLKGTRKAYNIEGLIENLIRGFNVCSADIDPNQPQIYVKKGELHACTRRNAAHDPHYKKPNGMLQWFLDRSADYGIQSTQRIVKLQLLVMFGGIHSTTFTATNILYNLSVWREYLEPLREEVRTVVADANKEEMNCRALQRMEQLDSFMKEAIHFYPPETTSFSRKTVQGITPGSLGETPSDAIAHDKTTYSMDAEQARNQFVTSNDKNLVFGYGKHACPGMLLAATEMKMIIAKILLEYEFNNESDMKERYPSHALDGW
ncbi:hypothetical protein N8T08_002543 [Aspergillus melleus]|uniref:Uncharacterized protein n=1 Tax=Aspergillus melleus TaxID=138277 RepID=A0ACC3B874_9EURO|nr:hypothetical protein N8T08_002543 [Aspergillus melleus]